MRNQNNNNLGGGANHPYSQLRAELQRTRLQRVREAGIQGRLWLPATSTHYDHRAQPKVRQIKADMRVLNAWRCGRVVQNGIGEAHMFSLTHAQWAEPNGSVYSDR